MTLDEQILAELHAWSLARTQHDGLQKQLEANHAALQRHERRMVVLVESRAAAAPSSPPIAPAGFPPPPGAVFNAAGHLVYPHGHPFAGYPVAPTQPTQPAPPRVGPPPTKPNGGGS